MAGSVNMVILVGNIGQDPDTRSFQNGGKVVNLSLATSESWKNRDGERQEKTTWHRIAIFNEGLADVAEKYVRKGSKIYVQGQLQTRKWQDRDGTDRYSTEVVLQGFNAKLVLLSDGRGGNSEGSQSRSEGRGGRSEGSRGGGFGGFNDDLDDDIPY